jgi:ArsR family transcriptional regulator, arsenate/arsenite/antimonite-responsive transcriptional repressor
MRNEETLNTLKVISQGSRWDIVKFIADNLEASAKKISVGVGIPPSTLSFHLKQLADANILEARVQGREIHYRIIKGQLRKAAVSLQDLVESEES